ncbi:hypothetical protein [Microcystis sp. BLCC-F209]|jgi:hypothetical protein|uniref:Uncharacterized protein n=1 Tax=Microcystis aeruginosa PCC 9808 TaxID=1160284 RepID=I4HPZ6_MICAE|nr:hypothetical protein MICAG_2360005 [Microcystis aeruginosa PCC 9808]
MARLSPTGTLKSVSFNCQSSYQTPVGSLDFGLGGTGRDVLMRIRRFIIDKYGKLSKIFELVSLH